MKKIVGITFVLIVLLTTSSSALKSQEQATSGELTSADMFDMEIEVGTQSAWTKKVPLTLKFKSYIDAAETQISWDVPSGISVQARHKEFIAIEKDGVYTAKANIIPERKGRYEIAANITVWQYNTNYNLSDEVTLEFDDELISIPDTLGYGTAVIIKYVIIGLALILVLLGLVVGGKVGLKKMKAYLKPPDF